MGNTFTVIYNGVINIWSNESTIKSITKDAKVEKSIDQSREFQFQLPAYSDNC